MGGAGAVVAERDGAVDCPGALRPPRARPRPHGGVVPVQATVLRAGPAQDSGAGAARLAYLCPVHTVKPGQVALRRGPPGQQSHDSHGRGGSAVTAHGVGSRLYVEGDRCCRTCTTASARSRSCAGSRPSAPGADRAADVRPSSMPTRATTTTTCGNDFASVASATASPARASSRPRGSAATAGSSGERSPGSPAADVCTAVTNERLSTSWPSSTSPQLSSATADSPSETTSNLQDQYGRPRWRRRRRRTRPRRRIAHLWPVQHRPNQPGAVAAPSLPADGWVRVLLSCGRRCRCCR